MAQSGKVRVEIQSEIAIVRRPARVLVYNGEQLVAEIIAEIEPKQGWDGGYYPCVTLKKL